MEPAEDQSRRPRHGAAHLYAWWRDRSETGPVANGSEKEDPCGHSRGAEHDKFSEQELSQQIEKPRRQELNLSFTVTYNYTSCPSAEPRGSPAFQWVGGTPLKNSQTRSRSVQNA